MNAAQRRVYFRKAKKGFPRGLRVAYKSTAEGLKGHEGVVKGYSPCDAACLTVSWDGRPQIAFERPDHLKSISERKLDD